MGQLGILPVGPVFVASGDGDGAPVVWNGVRRLVCAPRDVSCQISSSYAASSGVDQGFSGGGQDRSAAIEAHDGGGGEGWIFQPDRIMFRRVKLVLADLSVVFFFSSFRPSS